MPIASCNCDMIGYVAKALNSINDEASNSIKKFLSSQIASDGGFIGRDGKSDLYYTVFGIQLLISLKLKKELKQVPYFLQNFDSAKKLDFVYLASWIRCLALLQVGSGPLISSLLGQMEDYRSDDGGYNHLQKQSRFGTAYAAFLAHLAYRESGVNLPQLSMLMNSIRGLHLKDGSFANDPEMDSGSTTATSAAILLLNYYDEKIEQATIDNLLARIDSNGGFLAGPQSPIPDLLSTATALLALKTIQFDLSPFSGKHAEYISSLWNQDGGFSGHIFDDVSDCEYTFYALLSLGVVDIVSNM